MLKIGGIRVLVTLIAAVAVLGACQQATPEEKVASLRAYYSANANGFVVEEVPVVAETVEGEETLAADGEGEADAEDAEVGEEMAAEPIPVTQKVYLDFIVQHDASEKLPGITVDITMVDAQETEKHRWLHWVDTSNLAKATQIQLTYVIEDSDYVEGDMFSVEVRTPVPAAERGDYREFSVGG